MGRLDLNRKVLARLSSSGDVESLNVNVGKILHDLSSSFNPLHHDCVLNYDVRAVAPGQVCMSVVMPDELLHSFSVLLESMTGFFRFVGNKAHAVAATVKAHDLGEIAKTKKFVEDYEAEIFTLFDDYVKDGFDIKTATRQTNLTMKSFNHPWAVMNMTEATLRKSGRLRKPKESVKQTA